MMTDNEILKHIDHTQLKPFATWKDIEKLCEEAIQYQTASVCIPPAYIKRVHEKYGEKHLAMELENSDLYPDQHYLLVHYGY